MAQTITDLQLELDELKETLNKAAKAVQVLQVAGFIDHAEVIRTDAIRAAKGNLQRIFNQLS